MPSIFLKLYGKSSLFKMPRIKQESVLSKIRAHYMGDPLIGFFLVDYHAMYIALRKTTMRANKLERMLTRSNAEVLRVQESLQESAEQLVLSNELLQSLNAEMERREAWYKHQLRERWIAFIQVSGRPAIPESLLDTLCRYTVHDNSTDTDVEVLIDSDFDDE